MPYHVQRGDTIAHVTRVLDISWQKLRDLNPDAVGRSSKNGNWFLKEGAVVKGEETFQEVLEKAAAPSEPPSPSENAARPTAETCGQWTEYTVKRGDTLWDLAVRRFHVNLDDLMKDNQITDPRNLQPGTTLKIQRPDFPPVQDVVASWYGEPYHGRPMANGDIYNMHASTIAHRDLPFGTKVELQNPETGATVKAVVTDRGPFVDGRDVDLSYGLARKLSMIQKGVGRLRMKILS